MCEHGIKTTPVILSADREASWSLLPSSVFLLPGSTVQLENTYSLILKVTGQLWEDKKRISINIDHSYHQHSSPCLNWSNDKGRFSFNQPHRKRWGVKLVDVKHLPPKLLGVFFSRKRSLTLEKIELHIVLKLKAIYFFKKIGIHSIQGCTATTQSMKLQEKDAQSG